MNIDPALRSDSGQSAYGQKQRPPHSYPDVTSQTPGYEPLQPLSTPSSSSLAHGQQHQYYGVPTPNSYPNTGGQSNDSPFDQSPTAGNPSDPNDLKRSRACEACRQLKVRCEPDDNSPTGSCKRCAKANRQCVVTAPSRKRQKKTDSRVAELEKKLDAVMASLVARTGQNGDANLDPAIAQAQLAELQRHRDQLYEDRPWPQSSRDSTISQGSPSVPKTGVGSKRKLTSDYDYPGGDLTGPRDQAASQGAVATPKSTMPQVPAFQAMFNGGALGRKDSDDVEYIDVVDRQILDEDLACRIFDRYHTEMCHYLPIVVFQPGIKAEDIRRTKPILFLAIIAVASASFRPDLQPGLVSEVTRLLADRIMYRGEKSLELVQTLSVMTTYYQPPEKYEELNFNQLIHIAAVMALDIGIGKRTRPNAFAMWKEYMDRKSPYPDPNAAETRRIWLGCYYMCANCAMSLRRPALIRWSAYNDECLEVLATAPDALPSDKWLCHLVRAQRIAEDVGFQFSMDDPASVISLTDTKTQYHLKAFERQLREWRQNSTMGMIEPLINHIEAIINLYMHEIAMHHNHNIDDFKPPYNIPPEGTDETDVVTPAHIDSLTVCLNSIHNAFEAFLAMDVQVLRVLPTIFFVRNSYAAVALIKMYSAVNAKDSKFASIFGTSDLKVDYYLDAMIAALSRVGEGNQSRVAHKFGFIFNMIKSWHTKRTEGGFGPQSKPPRMGFLAEAYKASSANDRIWSTQAARSNDKAQHSGLQMLSDAAMGKNTAPDSDPASAAATALAATSSEGWAAPQIGQMAPPASSAGIPMDPLLSYGLGGPEMNDFGFTPDELTAMGSLLDNDPGWMNFPMEQGSGWAF